MKKLLLVLAFLWAAPALAQNPTCPTRPVGDSSNACASTAFVHNSGSGSIALPTGDILVGGLSGLAAPQPLSGDCTLDSNGVITCINFTVANGQVLANTSGSPAHAIGTNGTTWFDVAYCNTIGYIVARTTSAWVCSRDIPLNVTWFGADPTGVANSLAAFNAVGTAINSQGGGTMYVPKGTFSFFLSGTFSVYTQPIVIVYSNMHVQCDRGALLQTQSNFGGFNSALFTPGPSAVNFGYDGCTFKAYPGIAVNGTTSNASSTVALTVGTTAGFYRFMPVSAANMAATNTGKYYVDSVVDATHFTVAVNGTPTAPTTNAVGEAMTIRYAGSAMIGSQPGNVNWYMSNITGKDIWSAQPTGFSQHFIVMGSQVTLRNIYCTYEDSRPASSFEYGGEDCVHSLAPMAHFLFDNIHCLPSGDDCVAVLVENDLQPGFDSAINEGTISNVYGISEWAHVLDEIVSVGMAAGTIQNVYHNNIQGTSDSLGGNVSSRGVNIADNSNRQAIFSNTYINMNINCTNTALECYGAHNATDMKFYNLRGSNPKLAAVALTSCVACELYSPIFGANQTAATDLVTVDAASSGFKIVGGQLSNSKRDAVALVGNTGVITGVTFNNNTANGVTLANSNNTNVFGNILVGNGGFGIVETGSANKNSIEGNNIISGGTISTSGALTQVAHNIGYNPVGISGPTTVGASPATICAGSSAETHYLNQANSFNATVTIGGINIGTMTSNTLVVQTNLGPHECEVVTWSTTAPTYVKSVH